MCRSLSLISTTVGFRVRFQNQHKSLLTLTDTVLPALHGKWGFLTPSLTHTLPDQLTLIATIGDKKYPQPNIWLVTSLLVELWPWNLATLFVDDLSMISPYLFYHVTLLYKHVESILYLRKWGENTVTKLNSPIHLRITDRNEIAAANSMFSITADSEKQFPIPKLASRAILNFFNSTLRFAAKSLFSLKWNTIYRW